MNGRSIGYGTGSSKVASFPQQVKDKNENVYREKEGSEKKESKIPFPRKDRERLPGPPSSLSFQS